MAAETQMKFVHRHNYDGTVDAICTRCFQTVATVPHEPDLILKEQDHSCHGYVPVDRSYLAVRARARR